MPSESVLPSPLVVLCRSSVPYGCQGLGAWRCAGTCSDCLQTATCRLRTSGVTLSHPHALEHAHMCSCCKQAVRAVCFTAKHPLNIGRDLLMCRLEYDAENLNPRGFWANLSTREMQERALGWNGSIVVSSLTRNCH